MFFDIMWLSIVSNLQCRLVKILCFMKVSFDQTLKPFITNQGTMFIKLTTISNLRYLNHVVEYLNFILIIKFVSESAAFPRGAVF